MTNKKSIDWQQEFLRALPTIENIVAATSRKSRLGEVDAEEFRSYVMLKLIDRDYARLRQFGGRSRLTTYLNVVVRRLLLDFRVGLWGKWRPSTQAKSLGPLGIHLEQMVHRDGFAFAEAYEILSQRIELRASRDSYWRAFETLPCRPRRQWLDTTQFADRLRAPEASDSLEAEARRDLAGTVSDVLAAVLDEAPLLAKEVLCRRFRDGTTITRIAQEHRLKTRDVSRLIAKTLGDAREALMAAGVSWESVSDALSVADGPRIFEDIFASEAFNATPQSDADVAA